VSTAGAHVAIDLGASGGRVMVGRFGAGGRVELHEAHRFANGGVRVGDTLHWDALRIWSEIRVGLARVAQIARGPIVSVGVDTWGVDFGLLDRDGRLLSAPVHYRDRRTEGGVERLLAQVPAARLYDRTGIEILPINTLVQLRALVDRDDPSLKIAERLAMMPDLMHGWLSGVVATERTIASTTQLLGLDGAWATDLAEEAGVPGQLLGRLVDPGTVLGPLLPWLAEESGLDPALQVVAPAGHDTACAVAASDGLETAAYLSSGTWSLMGALSDAPVTTERARVAGFTNERAAGGDVRLQRNLAGLWPLQACLRRWRADGHDLDWDEVIARADAAPADGPLVDLSDPAFLAPPDMEAALQGWCRDRGQRPPSGVGEVARCCLESLALAHRGALRDLEQVAGRRFDALRVVGGGSRNDLLAQWTADACGVPAIAGPVEATALGNVLVQAVAMGTVASLDEGRERIAASTPRRRFAPRADGDWDAREARVDELRG